MTQPKQEPVAWADIQKEAQQIVESKFLWKKFIDGTPLSNDIACWMADFAQQYTASPQRTWAGLTGEEAMDVTRKEGHELLDFIYEYGTGVEGIEERIVAICKAIEAKLKEKNT